MKRLRALRIPFLPASRAGLLATLVLALAAGDPGAARTPAFRVLIADVSASVVAGDPARPARLGAWALEAARRCAPGDRALLLLAGRRPLECGPALAPSRLAREGFPDLPVPDDLRRGTDLEAALRAALGAIPPFHLADIVLLSDGGETAGDALAAADACRARGIPVHVYPVDPPAPARDAAVLRIETPGRVEPGGPFPIEAVIGIAGPLEGPIRVACDVTGAGTRIVEVAPGPGEVRVAFSGRAGEGPCEVRVRLGLPGPPDDVPGNDEASVLVPVGRSLRVLVLRGAEGGRLHRVLAGTPGIDVEEGVAPGPLARAAGRPPPWDAVVLENVSRAEVGDLEGAAIRDWVREDGAGLLVLGGGASFGPGGHAGGPIEEVLPVRCLPEDRGSQSLVIALDRSGSMDDPVKIAAVRGALAALAGSLGEADRAGLLLFADDAGWAAPLGPSGPAREALERLDYRPRGGTALLAAVHRGREALAGEEAGRRRLLLLITDGEFEGDARALGRELEADGIGVAVAATTEDPSPVVLERLRLLTAEGRNGRVHHVRRGEGLRAVLLRERHEDLERRERVQPRRAGASPLIEAFPGDLPPVEGWVRTEARPAAETAATADGDPLLASARPGAGRSAAFTADLAGAGGASWGEERGFWTGLLRWLARGRPAASVRAAAGAGGSGTLELTGAGDLPAMVAGRLGEGLAVLFHRTGLGRWTAEGVPSGADRVWLEGWDAPLAVDRPVEVERVLPRARSGLLAELAARAGGKVLAEAAPPRPGGQGGQAPWGGRGILLGSALAFLLLSSMAPRGRAVKERSPFFR